MTGTELRARIMAEFQADGQPPPPPNGELSQATCDVVYEGFIRLLESHVSAELCEQIAAIDDPEILESRLTSELKRALDATIRDWHAIVAASQSEFPDYLDAGKLRNWLEHPLSGGMRQ